MIGIDFRDRDVITVMLVSAAVQAVYLAAIPLGFECDAATFYAFAKALVGADGGVASSARPPLFPLFLVVSGAVWPGTFVFALLAHAVMGVLIPVLVWSILYPWGRGAALFGSVMLIIAATPFVGAKLILAEQLYVFLSLLSLFFFARYHNSRNPRFLYAFTVAGTAALLTRWEAQILLFFAFCSVLMLAVPIRGQLRHVTVALAIMALILGTYSVVRAIRLGDLRLIGNLHTGTGLQLFQRVYMLEPRAVGSVYSPALQDRIPDPIVPNPTTPTRQFISPSNGPATRQLHALLLSHANQHPESFRALKPLLARIATEPGVTTNAYDELFGQFDGKPSALADNIFDSRPNLRTAQYVFYAASVAEQRLGARSGDRLLLDAGIEALRNNPKTVVAVLADGFTLTGMSLEGIAAVLQNPLELKNWRRMFPLWGMFDYSNVPFDAGGCATAALPPRMLAEYTFDRDVTDTAFSSVAIRAASLGRNLVRACCGVILFAGWWLLFLSQRSALALPVLFTIGFLIFTIGISVSGGNSKYDLAFIPLLVIASTAIVAEAFSRFAPHPAAPMRPAVS